MEWKGKYFRNETALINFLNTNKLKPENIKIAADSEGYILLLYYVET